VEALLAPSKDPWLLGYRLVLTLWQLLLRETGAVFCYRPARDVRLRVAKGGIAGLGGVLTSRGQDSFTFKFLIASAQHFLCTATNTWPQLIESCVKSGVGRRCL